MPRTKKQDTEQEAAPKVYKVKRNLNRPKKLNLATKTQVDGKDYDSPKARPRTLEELWGFRGSKFGTNNEQEYRAELAKMNKADLQQACIKIGLMPNDSRNIMVDRLLKQFRIHTAGVNGVQTAPKRIPTKSDATEKLRRWMETAGGNTLR